MASETLSGGTESGAVQLTTRQQQRLNDRQAWRAYWKVLDLETRGTYWERFRYWAWMFVDKPVTWFRESVVDRLHDRFKMPYYHMKLARVPYVDECGVNDRVCFFEANEQYRMDKQVDWNILEILRDRHATCLNYHHNDLYKCAHLLDDAEDAELNFFIKYGELGGFSDVRDCYMKQKHRLIWERRHPEIMKERQLQHEEHKRKIAQGIYDQSFWRKGVVSQDKGKVGDSFSYGPFTEKDPIEGDRPQSRDWQYYKQKKEEPDSMDEPDNYRMRYY